MFTGFRRTPADAPQAFRHLRPGERYFVVQPFLDYDQVGHLVGECWTFKRHTFLPYEDGLMLFLAAPDGCEEQTRLQYRPDAQGPIVDALDVYLHAMTVCYRLQNAHNFDRRLTHSKFIHS